MPYGRIDEWEFSSEGQYVTGWFRGLRWRVNGRWSLWRLVNMTFRGLTELQEQAQNAAHMSAITHWVETNGWSQMGCDQIDRGQRSIAARDGSYPEMDCGRLLIATGYGLMTAGGSQEIDRGRRMTINVLSYTKLWSYNRGQICKHTTNCWRYGSSKYDTDHYSEHPSGQHSIIPN